MAPDDEILEQLKVVSKRNSLPAQFLRGIVFGIGSVIGIAFLVYLLLPALEKLPVVGQLLEEEVAPPIQETADTKLPSALQQQSNSTNTTTPSTTSNSTISGSSKIKADYYSVVLPAGWNLSLKENNQGIQLSRLTAESDDFASHTDDAADGPFTPIYYDSGAVITIHVTEPADSGEHGQVFEEKEVDVDGETALWHQFSEPSTFSGVQYDVHFDHAGRSYLIQFAAADSVTDAEVIFNTILDSFEFVD
ncbi:hypothetical protein KC644_02320 [Candidatus Berkelbacteria bacterium]|nr:hypothetical protein [Candidatus Berkelbacteria bacterium]